MEFVTVACVLNPGKGGRVFYTRRFERKDISLYEKLSTETWHSLEVAIEMNARTMQDFREDMRRFYYDADAHDSYLDQLGIAYPTLRQPDGRCVAGGSISEDAGGR